MSKLHACFLVPSVAVFALSACLSHTPSEPSLEVDASIASVTLGDDCGEGRYAEPGLVAGDCADEGPCGFCQQTGIRVAIDAAAEGTAVPFEVVGVRLLSMDGAVMGELTAREARVFVDGVYSEWDQVVQPGASLHVDFDTSAPDWNTIGGGDAWSTYGMSFRIEMDVRIDGVDRTLEFAPASREPEVVT